jgi:spermidine/putrescine transport system permease protein
MFRTVTLPLLAPGVGAAAFLAFVLSVDDFVISHFNSGTTVTFPLHVFGAARTGIPVQVNVLATILFLITAAAVVFVLVQRRRAERMATVSCPAAGWPDRITLASDRAAETSV